MRKSQSFAKLRDILIFIYTEEADARRVCNDADIDVGNISFSTKAINNWTTILLQAQKENKTDNLMAVTTGEYKGNEKLSKAWQDYLVTVTNRDVGSSPELISNRSERWFLGSVGLMVIVFISGGILFRWFPSAFSNFVFFPASGINDGAIQTPPSQTALFQDDFSSNKHGWTELEQDFESGRFKYEIVNGKYRKTANFAQTPWFQWNPFVPNFSAQDFELSVDATLIEAKDLDNDGTVIVISFRNSLDNANLYLASFNNAGYKLQVAINNQWSTIIDSTPSAAFSLQPGVTNTFGVSVKDSSIALYANGKQLITIRHSALDSAGSIGLGTGTTSTKQKVVVEFDNLVIK